MTLDNLARSQTVRPLMLGGLGLELPRQCHTWSDSLDTPLARSTPYVVPSGYAYKEPGDAQYPQFTHPSQQHYTTSPVAYCNHAMPPHIHRAGYSLATREPERYRAGGGGINRTPNTHLRHPWEESQQNDIMQLEIFTPNLMDGH
jgi:hypothetical protein